MDTRPVSYALCIVLSHDVAEQISRSSKQFPYSTPKSPTFQELVPIVGSHSIILSQVAIISLTGYILISLCDFINFFFGNPYIYSATSHFITYTVGRGLETSPQEIQRWVCSPTPHNPYIAHIGEDSLIPGPPRCIRPVRRRVQTRHPLHEPHIRHNRFVIPFPFSPTATRQIPP